MFIVVFPEGGCRKVGRREKERARARERDSQRGIFVSEVEAKEGREGSVYRKV